MRQHLIFDADDTLWENNIYFERAFEQFVAFLDHSTLTPPQVRAVLDEIELVNAKVHGYGSKSFGRNLQETYRRLAERHMCDADLEQVTSLAEGILKQPLELIEGVEETLRYLADSHDLTLFTKGHPEEQKLKVDRSGLRAYFGHLAIVKEKDVASYRKLVEDLAWDRATTWMIGNSPKSDVNPALEAGLNAVFIPHRHTWVLEKEEVRRDGFAGKLVELGRFSELRRYF